MMATDCSKDDSYKKRLQRLAAVVFFLCFLCLLQLALMHFGIGVPCLFHLITGLKCPGCGISHMGRDLLLGRFDQAFHDNEAMFILTPFIGFILIRLGIRYVKTGSKSLNAWENYLVYAMIAVLVVFGILRNVLW